MCIVPVFNLWSEHTNSSLFPCSKLQSHDINFLLSLSLEYLSRYYPKHQCLDSWSEQELEILRGLSVIYVWKILSKTSLFGMLSFILPNCQVFFSILSFLNCDGNKNWKSCADCQLFMSERYYPKHLTMLVRRLLLAQVTWLQMKMSAFSRSSSVPAEVPNVYPAPVHHLVAD